MQEIAGTLCLFLNKAHQDASIKSTMFNAQQCCILHLSGCYGFF